jgi:hypothetical protein
MLLSGMMRISNRKLLVRSLVAALLLMAAGSVTAAPLEVTLDYTFDTTGTTPGIETDPGFGNTWSYTAVDVSGAYTVSITSWSDNGFVDLDSTLKQAEGVDLGDAGVGTGLGVCDSTNGSTAQCLSNLNRRNIDNAGGYDWILIMLPEVMRIDTLTISPDGNRGRDVTYFTGWLDSAASIDGASYNELTAPVAAGGLNLTQYDVNYGRGTADVDIDMYLNAGNGEVWGNAILIGASMINGGDRFAVSAMSTSVPIPASIVLFLSALGVFMLSCKPRRLAHR